MSAKKNRLKARLRIEADRNHKLIQRAEHAEEMRKLDLEALDRADKLLIKLRARLGHFLKIDKPESMNNVARFVYHLSLHELERVNMDRRHYFEMLFALALEEFEKIKPGTFCERTDIR